MTTEGVYKVLIGMSWRNSKDSQCKNLCFSSNGGNIKHLKIT